MAEKTDGERAMVLGRVAVYESSRGRLVISSTDPDARFTLSVSKQRAAYQSLHDLLVHNDRKTD